MKNVAVVFGGISVEHDVSVITGVLTLNSLDRQKFQPVPIYIDKEGVWWSGEQLLDVDNYKNLNFKKLNKVSLIAGENNLYCVKDKDKKKKLHSPIAVAVCINCLHGGGEGGSLAGIFQNSFIPMASPDILPSAIAMDKGATKIFLKGLGIPYVKYILCERRLDSGYKKLNFPLIVKPTCCGSSIGITIANDESKLKDAVMLAFRYDNRIIIEEKLEGITEINCAGFKNQKGEIVISECEKPVSASNILSFEDKYVNGEREFPADIPESVSNKIKSITKKIYSSLNFTGIIRIDFFVQGELVFVNEINSVPGSLAYYLFSDTLKGYSEILSEIIRLAEINFAKESSVIKNFSTNLLSITGGKGGKGKK